MKPFYVISALLKDSNQLGHLLRHENEKDAIDHAKTVIGKRRASGQPDIEFFILKVVAEVGTTKAPISVRRLK